MNKDYPPHGDLKTIHPKLYGQFSALIDKMFKAHMGSNGPMNLFSYIPTDELPPDLGIVTIQPYVTVLAHDVSQGPSYTSPRYISSVVFTIYGYNSVPSIRQIKFDVGLH